MYILESAWNKVILNMSNNSLSPGLSVKLEMVFQLLFDQFEQLYSNINRNYIVLPML